MVMENIDADHLLWRQSDGGPWVEVASEQYDYVIDANNVLWVYKLDGDDLVAQRKCSDIDHAMAIAGAFEIESIRNAKRGHDWMNRPWPRTERND